MQFVHLTKPALLLGAASAHFLDEAGVLIAILITVVGILLRIYLANHRIAVEEHIKNNKMTDTEARRQIKFYETCSYWVTLLAMGLLILVVIDMAQ